VEETFANKQEHGHIVLLIHNQVSFLAHFDNDGWHQLNYPTIYLKIKY
jgi:hypothetical protein